MFTCSMCPAASIIRIAAANAEATQIHTLVNRQEECHDMGGKKLINVEPSVSGLTPISPSLSLSLSLLLSSLLLHMLDHRR